MDGLLHMHVRTYVCMYIRTVCTYRRSVQSVAHMQYICTVYTYDVLCMFCTLTYLCTYVRVVMRMAHNVRMYAVQFGGMYVSFTLCSPTYFHLV